MSDICEQYCPAYEGCIQVFDASVATRSSLVDQRRSLKDIPALADTLDNVDDYAALADMSDQEINRLRAGRRAKMAAMEDQLDHRIVLSESELATVGSALMECATAQLDCPGPTLSRLGRLAMTLAALRHGRRPNEADRRSYLEYFARCSSPAAKTVIADLPEALY